MPRNRPLPPGPGTRQHPTVKPPVAVKPAPKPPVASTHPPAKPKPPRGSDAAIGSTGVQKRAQDRLSRIIARGGKAPAGVKPGHKMTLGQARAIKKAILELNAKRRADAKAKAGAEAPFDPLAPLTGKAFDDELAAATRGQFGDSDRALADAYAKNQGASELTGSYYDQYKKSLDEASERVKQNNAALDAQSQGQVDTGYQQDSAAAQQRSDAASAAAGKLGLSGTQGDEGARAASAQRAQGNQNVAAERGKSGGTYALMQNQSATSLQAKAEALGSRLAERGRIDRQGTQLATEKGDFATNFRNKARESEREWAAVQEEFGLKEADQKLKAKDSAADRKLEASKLATQKLVAKLYSEADKTKAAATIRVAKLQLQKGKIDQKQYREIVNIYKGLPKKGTATPAKGDKSKTPLQSWEVDKKDKAVDGYTADKFGKNDHAKAVAKAVSKGIPKRLAELAWKEYVKSLTTPYDDRVRG